MLWRSALVATPSDPPPQDNNPIERTWGTPRDETGLPNHVDLVAMLDIVDLEKGQEVAGSRGYYLKGAVRARVFSRIAS